MTNQEVNECGMSDPDKVLPATVETDELHGSLQAQHSVPIAGNETGTEDCMKKHLPQAESVMFSMYGRKSLSI